MEPAEQRAADSVFLAGQIRHFVRERTHRVIERFLPSLRVPKLFAGQRIDAAFAIDIAATLVELNDHTSLTSRHIARRIVEQLESKPISPFACFHLAEVLAAYGPWGDNAIIAELSPAQRDTLRVAVDPSYIYQPSDDSLGGFANNYWCVLLRGEVARQKLGVLDDDRLLNKALARTRDLLLANPLGYFDDDKHGGGAYDIYSADVVLFVEPMWDLIGRDPMRGVARTHLELMETLALENGASFGWGRSIGALSVCMTLELAALGLRHSLTADRGRAAGLAKFAFDTFSRDWIADDLIAAHRYRMTFGYRGPHRLLQMTCDCLTKLAKAAHDLQHAAPAQPVHRGELFADRDEFVRFETAEKRHAGVWVFRRGRHAFQLPLVGGRTCADYAAWPRSPGTFENPVDSPMLVGVPRVIANGLEYAPLHLPAEMTHTPGTLYAKYDGFAPVGPGHGPDAARLPGRAEFTWRADGDSFAMDVALRFDAPPDAIHLEVPEAAATPLSVELTSDRPADAGPVTVLGQPAQRSFWGETRRLHQIDVEPAAELTIHARITPAVRVLNLPAAQDYNRGLYDVMPSPGVAELREDTGFGPERLDEVLARVAEADVFHIGWPEHMVGRGELSDADHDALIERFVGEVRRLGTPVVWTMHNRRPHAWPAERGRWLYRLWAPVVSACLHHSRWGESVMRAEYPFRHDCLHALVPHGHWGPKMRTQKSRAEFEAKYKLPPCAVRFGILGRYQPEKQIELMMEAFVKGAAADHQLVLTAYRPDTAVPDDPRVIKLPRKEWMGRAEIAEHNALCDVLIAAQTGDTYLTSGLVGDGVGCGLAMVVPDWAFYREILGDAAAYHDNTLDGLAATLRAIDAEKVRALKRAAAALGPAYDFAALAPNVMDVFRALRRRGRRAP
jgi:hypothetical protein